MILFTDIDPFVLDSFIVANPELTDEYRIYDLGRLRYQEEIPRLYGIVPDFQIFANPGQAAMSVDVLGNDFERIYFDYLLNGPGFLSIMSIAMREYYRGDVLYVYLLDRTLVYDSIVESVSRFLFHRYGIESTIASTLEDVWLMRRNHSLSVNGLTNIGYDITRAYGISPKLVEDIQNGKL